MLKRGEEGSKPLKIWLTLLAVPGFLNAATESERLEVGQKNKKKHKLLHLIRTFQIRKDFQIAGFVQKL